MTCVGRQTWENVRLTLGLEAIHHRLSRHAITHRLRDGAVMVYRRGDTKQQVYPARLKVPGVSGYVIRSLKSRDLPTALNQAEDPFYELRAEQKLGMDVRVSGNLKFKDLLKRFYAAHESGLSVHRRRCTSSWPRSTSTAS